MLSPPPLTEAEVRATAPEDVAQRGYDYWRAGVVEGATQQGPVLRAAVAGSRAEPYRVAIEFGMDGRPAYECDCPDFLGRPRRRRRPCKHIIATLLQWAHAPDTFLVERPVEELLAGEERDVLLAEIKSELQSRPALSEILAEPVPRSRRRARVKLDQVDRQVNFALSRHRREPAVLRDRLAAILERGVALFQSGQPADAARWLTRLLGRLLPLLEDDELEPRRLVGLAQRVLVALELAGLEAEWDDAERRAWLQQLMGWWAEDRHGLADQIMDLILHGYRREDVDLVEGWLRDLLRKPRHPAQRTVRWWRQRVLHFLLAFYDATGRHDAFLDLCWEEDEDARAALKSAELGRLDEARRLAAQGLGSAGSYQALAGQLWQRGEHALALEIAEMGLGYRDPWRPALLEWIAEHALALGDMTRGRRAALDAWRLAPTLERYRLLRAAYAGAEWETRRAELEADLERQGDHGLLVEILLDEGRISQAIALLPRVEPAQRREALTLLVAEGLVSTGQAAAAIPLFFDAADLIVAGRTRVHYARAAELLARASSSAESAGLRALFEDHLKEMRATYLRRPALLEELDQALSK